jgi:SAM-dependent methyltransferase
MAQVQFSFDTRLLNGRLDRSKEQIIPGHDSRYWLEFHLTFYRYAKQWAEGADVLDIGCGYGYGSNLLSKSARSVTGLDYHPPAIAFARENYGAGAENLRYLEHNANNPLPFVDDSFDLIVSSEVLEHVENQEGLIREVRRVCRSGGRAIIKTPNIVSDPNNTNPHHEHVFSLEEYREFMRSVFPQAEIFFWLQKTRMKEQVIEYPFPLEIENFGDPNPSDRALLVLAETVPELVEAKPGDQPRGDLLAVCPVEK